MFGGNYRFVLALTVVSLLGAGCGQPQPVPVPVNPNNPYGYGVGSCGGASGTPIDPSNPTTSANFNASSGSGSLILNIGSNQQPNLSAPVANVVASGTIVDPDISTIISQYMPGMVPQPSYCVSSSGLAPGWYSGGNLNLVLQGPMGGTAVNGQQPTIQVVIQGMVISGRLQGTMQVTLLSGTQFAQQYQLPPYQLQ